MLIQASFGPRPESPDQIANPGVLGGTFEAGTKAPEIGDGRIEDHRVMGDLSTTRQRGKVAARRGLHRAVRIAVEHATAANEARSGLAFYVLKHPEETVDGAPRSARGVLIHTDHEKAAVPPLPRNRERRTVRLPVRQVIVYAVKQNSRTVLGERAIASKHPDAG